MLIQSFCGAATRLVFAASAIFAFSAAAEAQYITYVGASGNDANPCTVVTAPCKTLQRAVNVTPAKGTVRVLTPLTSSVFINKSVTISGDGVPIIGQVTIGGASAIVTLRGLALNGVGGFVNGISIDSAAMVRIEDCTVERFTSDGIKLVATTATKLFILNTVSRDNTPSGDGLYADAVNAIVEIENSHFDGNGSSGILLKVAKATVLQSSVSGNVANGIILRTPNAKVVGTTANDNGALGLYSDLVSAKVQIENSHFEGNGGSGLSFQVFRANVVRSVASGNAGYGIIQYSGSSSYTETTAANNGNNGFHIAAGGATLASSVTQGNTGWGLYVASGAWAVIDDSVISQNSTGIFNDGTLHTYQNNVLERNNSFGYSGSGTIESETGF